MVVTRVTTANVSATSTTATAYTTAFGVALVVGDLVVVTANSNGTHVTNGMVCSDSVNGAYTTLLETQLGGASTKWQQSFYKVVTAATAGTATVSLTPYASNTASTFVVTVFRGLTGSVSRTTVGSSGASGTTATSPALASAPPVGDLVMSMASVASGTITPPTASFAAGSSGTTNVSVAHGFNPAADGASTYGGTWTFGTAGVSAEQTVAFAATAPTGIARSPDGIPGLAVRFRASDITGLADGAGIGTWNDALGTSTATQGTAANQPTFQSNVVNGQAVARFNGTTHRMAATGVALSFTNGSPGATTFTVLSAASIPASGSVGYAFVAYTGASNGRLYTQVAGTGPKVSSGARRLDADASSVVAAPTANAAAATWYAATVTVDHPNNSLTAYQNGTAGTAVAGTGAGNFSPTNSPSHTIGSTPTPASFFAGDIAEIIMYNRVLSAAERSIVHSYIQEQYSIIVSDYTVASTASPRPTAVTNRTAVMRSAVI